MTAPEVDRVQDVVVVGVGGQGILLATDVMAGAFLAAGFDVKKSEVHGMAQRGGSVESHVRRDRQRVYSPLVSSGRADVLLSFEASETLRFAHYVRPAGAILYSTHRLAPPEVAAGRVAYPDDIQERLRARYRRVLPVDAMHIARDLGNPRVANTVLLGAFSRLTDVSESIWERAVLERVPRGAREVNRRALAAGIGVARRREHA